MTSSPAPSKQSRWGSFLQGAVAGIEGRLDAILTEDGGASKPAKPAEKTTEQTVQKSEIALRAKTSSGTVHQSPGNDQKAKGDADLSRSSSRNRTNDRLQERLARAVVSNTSQQRRASRPSSELPTRVGSPVTAEDVVRGSTEFKAGGGEEDQNEATLVNHKVEKLPELEISTEGSQPPDLVVSVPEAIAASPPEVQTPARQSFESERSRPSLDQSDQNSNVRQPSRLQNGYINEPKSSEEYELEIAQMREDYQKAEIQRQEEMHANLERIDALQAKMKYLAEEAVQSARKAMAEADPASVEKKLAEKDEQIALLMEEGQMLSKAELKYTNTIKMLRAKSTEGEKAMIEAKRKLAISEQTILDTQAKLKQAEAAENQANERMRQITRIEQEVDILKSVRDAANQTIANLKKQLQDTLSRAEQAERKAQTEALETERALVATLRGELSTAQTGARIAAERAAAELRTTQESASRAAERARLKELGLRSEISSLESSIEVLRARTEEASSGATGDTQAKLLRQIETLQTQYALASENWQGIEAALMARLEALEKERDELLKRDAEGRRKAREANSRARRLEEDLSEVRERLKVLDENLREQKAQEERLKQRLVDAERATNDANASFEREKERWEADLQRRIEQEKAKWRLGNSSQPGADQASLLTASPTVSHRKPSVLDLGTLHSRRQISRTGSTDAAHLLDRPSIRRASGQPPASARQQSDAGTPTRQNSIFSLDQLGGTGLTPETPTIQEPDEIFPDDAPTPPSTSHRTPTLPLGDVLSASTIGAGPSVQLVERLSTTVRRLESERASAREEFARLTAQRDEAREEVVALMREVEEKRDVEKRMMSLEKQLKEMEVRYENALEMLGEKSERCEELVADVDDLKKMYRDLVDRAMK